jgi:secondary thiamine-phosphate synthase enzyme
VQRPWSSPQKDQGLAAFDTPERESQMFYTLRVRSGEREQMVDFTDEVRRRLKEEGATDGICVLYVQHTTAGLTINENADKDVQRDMLHALRKLIPQYGMDFRHGEENSDAHIKTSLVGTSVTVAFHDGELMLARESDR